MPKKEKAAGGKSRGITLSQLRALVSIYDNDLNATAAAGELNVAQPSISKKLSGLEKTIGQTLFYRNGKRFQYETDLCRRVVDVARAVLLQCDNIAAMARAEDAKTAAFGELSIGTTHTQARYILPDVLKEFRREYPGISVTLRQGAPGELVRMLNANRVDLVICTEDLEANNGFRTLVLFKWNRCLVVPPGHPLAREEKLTLKKLAAHPLITYVKGFTGRAAFDGVFADAGLNPKIIVSAADADVVKTYVRSGFGGGIIAEMAYLPDIDSDLVMRPLGALFPEMCVRLAYQSERFVSSSMQRFIQLFRLRTSGGVIKGTKGVRQKKAAKAAKAPVRRGKR